METSQSENNARLKKPLRITEQTWPEETVPAVSVFCITYNHEKFIRDAIEGFLMQETTFPVEIFVHDDASTDGTDQIVKEYAEKYPQLFRTVLQAENQYAKDGFRFVFEHLAHLRGKFVALCEGDDYWTNSHKLLKQVDVLEDKIESSLVFHKVRVSWTSNYAKDSASNDGERAEEWTVSEVIAGKTIHTCSMLYRKSMMPAVPAWCGEVAAGDIPLQLMLGDAGPIAFVPEVLGVYRKHSGGVTNQRRRETPMDAKNLEDIYVKFNRHCDGRYSIEIARALADVYAWTSIACRRGGERCASLRMAVKAMMWAARSLSPIVIWQAFFACFLPARAQRLVLKWLEYKNKLKRSDAGLPPGSISKS